MPVANARMYSATPAVKAAWRELLRWVLRRADLPWGVIDFNAPAPLSQLWSRGDLGLAMMCGLPFAQRAERPTLIAAPVPSPARYARKPIYFTDIVVRADSAFQSLEDTFGGVVGYTVADSMSGGVALRNHLAPYVRERGAPLYRSALGGLLNARGVIDALVAGRIDVGPLDSYYHDLLRRHDPAFASHVRVISTTQPQPIPPLVATAGLSEDVLQRLRDALHAAPLAPQLQGTMDCLLLAGFDVPNPGTYAPLADIALAAPTFEELT